MKRIVGAVLLVASIVVSMPAVGHPENMSLQEVHELVQGEMQRIQDEMNEAQFTRFDLLLRVQMIERYMHWFVPEFTNEWEQRFPEKVKNMKEAGVWPEDENLYGRRFNQLERVVFDEWVRLRDEDLAGYAAELHKRISELEAWARRQ